MIELLRQTVTVVIDRPLGSRHPLYSDMIYPVNYGYIEGVFAGDKKEVDCYILGIDKPLKVFRGTVIAIIKRLNDAEDKLVVSNKLFSKEEIIKMTNFTEKYFDIEVIM